MEESLQEQVGKFTHALDTLVSGVEEGRYDAKEALAMVQKHERMWRSLPWEVQCLLGDVWPIVEATKKELSLHIEAAGGFKSLTPGVKKP